MIQEENSRARVIQNGARVIQNGTRARHTNSSNHFCCTLHCLPLVLTLAYYVPTFGSHLVCVAEIITLFGVETHPRNTWMDGDSLCYSGRSFWPQLSGKTGRPRQRLFAYEYERRGVSPRPFIFKHCKVRRMQQGHEQGGTYVAKEQS